MPNFVTLCPILIYLPAIIIVSVAMIAGVTHGVIAWMGRGPAALNATEGQIRVRKMARKGGWQARPAGGKAKRLPPSLRAFSHADWA